MRRHIALTILMVVIGVILLLPGVCALFFMAGGAGFGVDSSLIILWVACLLVSAGGLWLIVKAFR